MDVLIVGGGIGGLTLALSLHQAGLSCQVFEAASEATAPGLGINLLPHAVRELTELGLQDDLAKVAVATQELCFYNRHGQSIWREARGLSAGYDWPQFSIHRGDLQRILLDAVCKRIGKDRVHFNRKCIHVDQDESGGTAIFSVAGSEQVSCRGSIVVGCDGLHSVVRRQLYPHEGLPLYSNISMWRGAARVKPFLTAASMALVGSTRTGKLVVYPIRHVDADGMQLVNWVVEMDSGKHGAASANREAKRDDFFWAFQDWSLDWLDIAALIGSTETVYQYPMVDRDPLARWSFGRISLLGDAAHPMYPVGSNGAVQAILDARTLAGKLRHAHNPSDALKAYEEVRLRPTSDLVLLNRATPPDAILSEVDARTGGLRFDSIENIIRKEEITAIFRGYADVAGFDKDKLRQRPSLV